MLQGESEHRRVKKFYPFAKTGDFRKSIAVLQRRERQMHTIMSREADRRHRIAQREAGNNGLAAGPSNALASGQKKRGRPRRQQRMFPGLFPCSGTEDPLPPASYFAHHQISDNRRNNEDISSWLNQHRDDPAFVVSLTGRRNKYYTFSHIA